MSKISKNIKKFRKLCDMTQEDLATKIHVTRQTVSSWETDRTQPDIHILQALAEAFDVEIEELIYGKRKNTAEEKEKQLFGNTLVTVLSILGCLLIGAGVVLIFVKLWDDFSDALKMFTCFIPALLGQGVGIYTYIKKKESLPWCEGASVLWLLGVGVTATAVLSNVNLDYYVISDSWLCAFMALSAVVLMLVFRTLSPLAAVHGFSLTAFNIYLDDCRLYSVGADDGIRIVLKYLLVLTVQAAATALCFYLSSRLYKKEKDIIRYSFASWVNFIGLAVFLWIALERTNLRYNIISLVVFAAIICFIIGQKQTDFVSPYRVLGLPFSAAALCFLGMFSDGARLYEPQWVNILMVVIGLIPAAFLIWERTGPKSIYLRAYGLSLTGVLLAYNIYLCIDKAYYSKAVSLTFEKLMLIGYTVSLINFFIALPGLVMLIVYGAKERKLLYLNLGFVLSCAIVIARLYLLDLGLIVTGLLLIACGAGLLAVNLKISRLREKERLADLCEGEEEEQ